VFFALIELVSYYAVGHLDTGKYPVKKTLLKKIIVLIFWILISLYLAIFSAMVILVLTWSLLGAVLNPNRFLPAASGSVTFITFVLAKFTFMKHLNEKLQEGVGDIVNEKLAETVSKTIQGQESG
jgi:hypothetical protein